MWEHTKLVAIPMLLWAALVGWRTRRMPGALIAGVAGGVVGAVLMVVGFYSYVALLGAGSLPMDLALFLLCALAALAVFEPLRHRRVAAWAAWLAVSVELAVFAVLTVAPPDLPMFVSLPRG